MSDKEKEMLEKLKYSFNTDEDELDEKDKEAAENVVKEVKGKLSEMGFKKTRNPLDRIHGYGMRRNKDRIDAKTAYLTGLEFASPCRIRRIYFVHVKVKKDGVERRQISIQPDAGEVLDYIKNNI